MNVSFNGVGQVCATFLGEKLAEGHVVKLTGNGTVGECAAGDAFCGVTTHCCGDACTVQVCGFATVRYSGSAPTVGWSALLADGSGGVKAAGTGETGRQMPVVDVDTTGKTVTILL